MGSVNQIVVVMAFIFYRFLPHLTGCYQTRVTRGPTANTFDSIILTVNRNFFASLLPEAKVGYEEAAMKRSMIFRVLAILLLFACNSAAYGMEKIDWEQLVPPVDQSKNPFKAIPVHMRHDFKIVWNIYKLKVAGNMSENQEFRANKSINALEAAGVDVRAAVNNMVEYIRLRKENDSVLVEELNGKSVSIEGYLLPTEFSGDRIVEFLLVPSDGACVHTPVPPLNQLVYVKFPRGIDNPGLFAPVRVGGHITTEARKHTMSFSDGQSAVEAGYSMLAARVERYAD